MGDFPVDTILALIGIAVPVAAFLWEFAIAGRRRLGYRVQMDTPVTGEVEAVFPGVLSQLRRDAGANMRDLSIVLVRIENSGTSTIEAADYLAPVARVGLHLRFPQRRVVGMAVTELSDQDLADSLGPNSGIGVREDTGGHIGVIDLPKVPLNRGDHYKVLAILQRSEGTGEYPDPILLGGIKRGRVTETKSRTGVSRVMLTLIAFLVLVIVVQFVVAQVGPKPDPLDCASGKLTVVGSTAFEPVIRDAADQYGKRCTGAEFAFEFAGSERGLDHVTEVGADPSLITISDGSKGPRYPALLARPLALSIFTVIVHKDLGITDLTAKQIADLFQGRITRWSQIGGPDLPVVLVDRTPGSGTRTIFESTMLGGDRAQRPHQSCTAIKDTENTYCDVAATKDMHKAVADIPGAIGYSELSEARKADMGIVTINGVAADREQTIAGSYPFWGVEYAYSNGDLPGDSLAASFLHYLTVGAGNGVVRAHGNEPCDSVLLEPGRCVPDR
ncbi:substrate-binding domain-containing protein [Nocardia sp. NBC_01377]|uniref:substrate-binding domain-containing protein n=1 Tax=Nocardia sp. NBC_01377 TaxID=2903595 RepID=UPI00324608AB